MPRPEEEELSTRDIAARLGGAAALTAGAYAAGTGGLERLIGAQRLYHGTSDDAAKGILQQGLLASKGGDALGSGGALGDQRFIDASKNHIHVAKGPLQGVVTGPHAALAQAKSVNKNLSEKEAIRAYIKGLFFPSGTVVQSVIPYEEFTTHFQQDPDHLPHVAFRSQRSLKADELGGGVNAIIRGRSKNLKEYIQQNPRRFLTGAALAALAGGGIYGAVRMARPAAKELAGRLGAEKEDSEKRAADRMNYWQVKEAAIEHTAASFGLRKLALSPGQIGGLIGAGVGGLGGYMSDPEARTSERLFRALGGAGLGGAAGYGIGHYGFGSPAAHAAHAPAAPAAPKAPAERARTQAKAPAAEALAAETRAIKDYHLGQELKNVPDNTLIVRRQTASEKGDLETVRSLNRLLEAREAARKSPTREIQQQITRDALLQGLGI